MKIGIVALSLLPEQMGGIETYLRDLLNGIDQSASTDEYTLFIPKIYKNTFPQYEKINVVGIDLHGLKPRLVQKFSNQTVFKQAAKTINRYKLDVAHYPLQIILPQVKAKKVVISIMDIQQEYYPEYFSKEDLAIRRKEYKSSCEAADHIISISEFTKHTLIEKFKIDSSKVTTIHLAVVQSKGEQKAPDYNLPKKFLFYPAASWPHKNHLKLLEAFKEFHKEQSDIGLVLTGIKKQKDSDIDIYINKNRLSNTVCSLGYVSREEMNYLFSNATALVFPSKFEGFGIPIIEAMSVGTPVIAANSTSIPEITQGSVLLFDPDSKDDIISVMKKITSDSKIRKELIEKGKKQAKKFTVSAMTNKTIDVYREVLSGK